jgi:hypothetical protein
MGTKPSANSTSWEIIECTVEALLNAIPPAGGMQAVVFAAAAGR